MANRLSASTKEIIPVSTAIERTTNWRNFCSDKLEIEDKRMLPKAVYISKEDIEDLAEYCRADESIAGVRAYFTLNVSATEDIKNEIRFVMVLVKTSDKLPFGEDMLYKPAPGKYGDDGDSNVYDFTKPCPDYCDPTSPLFGDDPGKS